MNWCDWLSGLAFTKKNLKTYSEAALRYLAVDYGEKRTGIAVCDQSETIATPIVVLQGQGSLAERIVKIIEEEHAQAILMGLPLNMDGTEGPMAKKVRNFAKHLSEKAQLEVEFFDERLSSFDAEQKLAGLEITRKTKKKHLDAIAAASFLQGFIDQKNDQ